MAHLRDIVNTPQSRKRSRADSTSSFEDFSPIGMEDLEALNMLEAKFAHAASPLSRKRKRTTPPVTESRLAKSPQMKVPAISKVAHIVRAPLLDVTAPANNAKPHPSKILTTPAKTEPSTSTAKGKQREASPDEFENEFEDFDDLFPEPEPEPDYDSWFRPAAGPVPALVGFVRPSKDPGVGPKIIQPSAAALEAAKKLLASVETEEEPKDTDTSSNVGIKAPLPQPFKSPLSSIPIKADLTRVVPDAIVPLATPSVPSKRVDPVLAASRTAAPTTSERVLEYKPSHPESRSSDSLSVVPKVDVKASVELTPVRKATPQPTNDAAVPTPRHLGMRSRPRGPPRSKFATPWKKGTNETPLTRETPSKPPPTVQYHQPRSSLGSISKPSTSKAAPQEAKRIAPLPNSVFDLNPPQPRKKLSELTITKRRSMKTAIEMGIPAAVGDIDTWNAQWWAFEDEGGQGVDTAFDAMKKAGCSLVKKDWVENHWILVVWKLASMVVLWPEAHASRWSFKELLNQLLYRYEREINRCERPAVRLIQERDASPNSAMVLCVFEIEDPSPKTPEGTLPNLVLTDGWYRIRARIDLTLATAVKNHKIRVGTKLEIIGAKLDAHRKDADEVLKSFNSSSIIISGNGTHLAPWHSKLGFKQRPSIPTLNSLTGQGGVVPLLFITVHNIYPLEYVETTADGSVQRDQDEERAVQAEWQKRRAGEEAKLRDETCKTLERMEGLIDRLETIAGSSLSRIQASEESPPGDIEARVEDIEEAEDQKPILKGLKPTTAAWMAVSLRQKYLRQRETMVMDIESELASSFPARNVRAVRVLVVKDARTHKKPALRTCQITMWDAEAMREALVEGKTYMVTNLMPQLPRGWTRDQIFLFTRRDTQWRRIALPTTGKA